MNTFVIFLAWAVVSGASAWSSSEVSCASCGSECQKACGTRNFRACCFNFQRRRRSQIPSSSYSLKSFDDSESSDIQRLLKMFTDRAQEPQLPQILRSFSRSGEEPLLSGPTTFKDSQFLSSLFPAFLQDSSEEDIEEGSNVLLLSQGGGEGRLSGLRETGGSVEDVALSRLVSLALHHPLSSSLRQQIHQTRYPPPPSKIRK